MRCAALPFVGPTRVPAVLITFFFETNELTRSLWSRRDATRRDASEMAVPPAGDGNALLSPGPAPEADNNHSESHGCSSQHHEQFIAILFPYVRGLSACVHAVLCAGASVVVVAAAGRTIPRARVSCALNV